MRDWNSKRQSRRDLLCAGTVSLLSGLAGCNLSPNNIQNDTARSRSESGEITGFSPENVYFVANYRLNPSEWGNCSSIQPAIGQYETITADIVNDHIDQLRGAGISEIIVDINDRPDLDRLAKFSDAQLSEEIAVQFRYGMIDWFLEDVAPAEQLSLIADGIRSYPTYATYHDRPILTLGNLASIIGDHEPTRNAWHQILSPFDGPAQFIENTRRELTVNGKPPFLIGEVHLPGRDLIRPQNEIDTEYQRFREMLQAVDGIRNTFDITTEMARNGWESVMPHLKHSYRILHQFAEDNELEFVPVAAPGRHNHTEQCPTQNLLPRSEERFHALLRLAAIYATSPRVTIESYNDWMAGTQIELGTFDGTKYGRTYLETVRTVGEQYTPAQFFDRGTYHISPDGSDSNVGSTAHPLATIQEGVRRATPGDTVQVHAGTYQEQFRTIRDGTPEQPITVTGPPDALLHPPADGPAVWIKNNHIRLTGLTIDGLLNPAKPEELSSYSDDHLLDCRPPDTSNTYLEDIVVAPHALGNSERAMTVFERTKHLEIGPFKVIGIAGAGFLFGDNHTHVGEIIYLGQPPSTVERDSYPWPHIDQSRHIHVHHIDNSAGYPHSELVNTKLGTYDVLVEYCTDGGGSQNTESEPSASISFTGHNATLRWCDLRNGQGRGVEVLGGGSDWLADREDPPIAPQTVGTGHAIYGNTIKGFDDRALNIEYTSPEEQRALCGNNITGNANAEPQKACPSSIPKGNGIGYTGGDSPWK